MMRPAACSTGEPRTLRYLIRLLTFSCASNNVLEMSAFISRSFPPAAITLEQLMRFHSNPQRFEIPLAM